jgi:hypothetical protein
VVRYLRETFTLRVENEPVNSGRGRRTRVEGRRPHANCNSSTTVRLN